DMARVAEVHDSLSHINSVAGNVLLFVDVGDSRHRAAIHAHAQFYFGVILESEADLRSTLDWRGRLTKKDQSHSVARGQADKVTVGTSPLIAGRSTDDFSKLLGYFYLLLNWLRRVSDQIH